MKKYIQVPVLRSGLLTLFLMLASITGAMAQSPGQIVVKFPPNATTVLDPNGDQFITANGSAFIDNRDEGPDVSEIPYRPFPSLALEPTGDLRSGNAGGQLDLVSPAIPLASQNTGSPVAVYFDGVNVMFRMRVGATSNAFRGYSILIDNNNNLGATSPNPGFEFEVLYATNGSVQVIDHRTAISNTIFSGSMDQYAQRSVAASTNGGNADYFYDFYVPLSSFAGGITNTTPLRMVGSTVTSPQSALIGTVADVGGVNFQAYGNDAPAAWSALIGIFPLRTLNTINSNVNALQIAAAAPAINSPIVAGSTSISGTSSEIVGSVVSVFQNGVSICGGSGQPACPTVSANGTWTISGLANNLLVIGNNITARVTAPGKVLSPFSSAVAITEANCATPAPRITGTTQGNSRQIIFEPSYTGNQRINIYSLTSSTPVSTVIINPSNLQPITLDFITASSTTYYITTTPLGTNNAPTACESPRSNYFCRGAGQSFSPIITHVTQITSVIYDDVTISISGPTPVPQSLSSITISVTNRSTAGGILRLYRNGVATDVAVTLPTTGTGNLTETLNITGITPALTANDILTARVVITGGCGELSAPSNQLIVSPVTPAPTIDAPVCGTLTALTGTSTAPIGSTIQFYTGGTAGTRTGSLITQANGTTPVTAVVTSTGVWVADFSNTAESGIAPGTTITARATATGNLQSVNSAPVTTTAGTAGVLTVNPITAGQTVITGTAPESSIGGIITIYIDGTQYETSATVSSDATWGVEGFAAADLYPGASVTATFTPAVPNACESAPSEPVTISCITPAATFTLSTETATVCSGGTATYTLSGSEFGILYTLIVNGEDSGNSVIGTGGAITLTSGVLTNEASELENQSVTYRARSLAGEPCDAFGADGLTIQVQPALETEGLIFEELSDEVCANEAAIFTLTGTNPAYTYQLVNAAGIAVGNAVPGNADNAIELATDAPTNNTSYGLLISTGTGDDACSTILEEQVDVFIISPVTDNTVTATRTNVCVGDFTTIEVETQPIGNFEYVVYRTATASNGLATDTEVGRFRGDGSVRNVTTEDLTTEGTEIFYVTVENLGNDECGILRLANEVNVTVTNEAITAEAGQDVTICSGETVQLQANEVGPNAGRWSQTSGATTVQFSNPNSPTAIASGFTTGEYTLRWTSSSECNESTSFSELTVTVNCGATYTVYAPRYNNEYANGDILALAEDPDGPISGATLVSGTMPQGLDLEDNGNIIVLNRTLLGEGVFPLTIELPQGGQSTVLSIVIRLLGNEPIIIPLPVELVYFTATVRNNQAHLEWLTASELDNDRFEVERSLDARSFEKVGTVKGKGTTSLETKYTFTDRTPVQGTVYYRLKQVDTDGQFAYSNVIAVNAKGLARELATQAYPNPFQDVIKVTLMAPEAQEAVMTIYDMNGRRVVNKDVQLDAGVNRLELNLEQLQSGMYILKVVGQGIESTTRIMKN